MFKFWLKSPLFDAAPADGPAGGGSGAGADPTPGAFDAAAFKAELLTEIRKDLNGITKGLKNDITKLFQPKQADPPADPVTHPADPSKPVDPEKNALALELKRYRQESEQRIKALEDQNNASRTKNEEMERDGAIRDQLGKFEFMSPEAKTTAFQILKNQVQRSEEGGFVVGELALDKFIEAELPGKHAYLLKGKDVSGANARPGKAGGGKKWDLDTVLRPENFSKLNSAEQAEVRQLIASSL